LQTTEGLEGVLYAHTHFKGDTPDEDARFLVAVANLAGAALERKRLESEAASLTLERATDELKSTIISSVSHELKTPLSAATARITGLLEEGQGCDSQRVQDELIAVSADLARLNAAIVDLLDVSRLESDAWRPQPELYEVSEILGTVLSRVPLERTTRVVFDLPESTPFVHVDFSQMVRALANIVENALAYSPADQPVRVHVAEDSDDVRIEVEDRGQGVLDSEKTLLFGKFFRGSAAAAVPGGTGLGLAIARDIVESQGGTIAIEDAEPTGARFVVTLPVAVIGAEAE
jgi:two-component system sensor histidine kinase KdpD